MCKVKPKEIIEDICLKERDDKEEEEEELWGEQRQEPSHCGRCSYELLFHIYQYTKNERLVENVMEHDA